MYLKFLYIAVAVFIQCLKSVDQPHGMHFNVAIEYY